MSEFNETEKTKFWWETSRTIVLGVAAFAVTWLMVKPSERHTEYSAFLEKTRVEMRRSVVDDFCKTSYAYTDITYKALRAKNEATGADIKTNSNVIAWMGIMTEAYDSDRNRLLVYFGDDLEPQIKEAKDQWDKLKVDFDKNVPKERWEVDRQRLKDINNNLARLALKKLDLY
jgi:hypothetical protein